MVVAGCCGDAGGNIDEGEGGVGGGKEDGPLPLLYPLLLLADTNFDYEYTFANNTFAAAGSD